MRRADGQALFAAWQAARKRGLNNRAAALDADVSEAQLLASGCGRGVTRLDGDFLELLASVPELGELKSVVRNAFAVLERTGSVVSLENDGRSTLIHGDTFLLRSEVGEWTRGFALTEQGKYGIKRSIQFFTDAGVSAAKLFLTVRSNQTVYQSLVQKFTSANQDDVERDIAAAEVAGRSERAQWSSGFLGDCLFAASRLAMPVEVKVANDCAFQTTIKTLERIKRSERRGWINVLDDGLDLHLHEARIEFVQVSGAGDAATLHWYADDGNEALSMRVESCGAEWAAAAIGLENR